MTNADDHVAPALRVALQRLVSLSPASRTNIALLDWLREEHDANQKEIVGIFRALDELVPTQPSARMVFIKVAEYVQRKGYHMVHAKEVEVMASWFNAALASQYTTSKRDRAELDFMNLFQRAILFLPCAAHLRRLAAGGLSKRQREESLAKVMQWQLGLKVYGAEASRTATASFTDEVNKAVGEIYAAKSLSIAELKALVDHAGL